MARGGLLAGGLCALWLVFACSSIPGTLKSPSPSSLNIVTICNSYVSGNSKASIFQLTDHAEQFMSAASHANIKGARLASVSDRELTHAELFEAIMRYDSPETLTIAFIASHGSPEGFLLHDPLSFDELYSRLDSDSKGKVLLIVDMCYAGVLNEVLSKHHSSRIFAITGTRGKSLERWYRGSGSFGKAVSNAMAATDYTRFGGGLTFGRFYDMIEGDIRDWNSRYSHADGPISDAGMYGPRELVLFGSNS